MNTYGLQEAAQIARVHPQTLRKMASRSEVPATKIGRSWIFPCHLFDSWIAGDKPRAAGQSRRKPIELSVSDAALRKAVSRITTGADWENEIELPSKPTREVSYQALRGRQQRRATPQWADREKISAMYRKARLASRRTGVLHCVDHIVPILGRSVCGLHVHYNMQVITQVANSRKSNRVLE